MLWQYTVWAALTLLAAGCSGMERTLRTRADWEAQSSAEDRSQL